MQEAEGVRPVFFLVVGLFAIVVGVLRIYADVRGHQDFRGSEMSTSVGAY
jgi:hypothetical protein